MPLRLSPCRRHVLCVPPARRPSRPAWAIAASLCLGITAARAATVDPLPAPPAIQPAAPASGVEQLARDATGGDYRAKLDAIDALGQLTAAADVDAATPALVRAAGDDDWYVRVRAVEALGAVGRGDATGVWQVIRWAAGDRVRRVREAAVAAAPAVLARGPDAPPADARRQLQAVREIASAAAGPRRPRPAEAGGPVVPEFRGTTWNRLAPDEQRNYLLDHLLDEPGQSRAPAGAPLGAAGALAALGPDAWRALPILFVAFRGADPARADRAAELLARFGGPALPVFTAALDEPAAPAEQRLRALRTLLAMGDEARPAAAGVGRVVVGAKKPDEAVALAVRILAQTPPADRMADVEWALLKMLKDDAHPLRADALRAMAAMEPGAEELPPIVIAGLKDRDNPQLREACIEVAARVAAQQFGRTDPAVRDALVPLLRDGSTAVRVRAAVALKGADPDAVRTPDALVLAVRDKDYAVRAILAAAVRRVPGQTALVTSKLEGLATNDPDGDVRTNARYALAELKAARAEGETPPPSGADRGPAAAAERPVAIAPAAGPGGPRLDPRDVGAEVLRTLSAANAGPEARVRAAAMLRDVPPGDVAATGAMAVGLADVRPGVQAAAATGLALAGDAGLVPDRAVVKLLWRLAVADDRDVREAAQAALNAIGPANAAGALRPAAAARAIDPRIDPRRRPGGPAIGPADPPPAGPATAANADERPAGRVMADVLADLRDVRDAVRAKAATELAGTTASAEIEMAWRPAADAAARDPSPEVRRLAAAALKGMQRYAVGGRRDDIAAALAAAESGAAADAPATALPPMDAAMRESLWALGAERPEARAEAADRLNERATAADIELAWRPLARALKDDSVQVRQAAAIALAAMAARAEGGRRFDVERALVGAVDDDDTVVRFAALEGLRAGPNADKLHDAVYRAANDPVAGVRHAAAAAASDVLAAGGRVAAGPRSPRPPRQPPAYTWSAAVNLARFAAAEAFRAEWAGYDVTRAEARRAVDLLAVLYSSDDPGSQQVAACQLVHIVPVPAAVSVVREAFRAGPSPPLIEAMSDVLDKTGQGVPDLMAKVNGPRGDYIANVVFKAGPRTLPDLLPLVRKGDPAAIGVVARWAPRRVAAAVGGDSTPVVEALAAAVGAEEWQARRAAAAALGDFGADAKAAVPALAKATADKNPNVSFTAIEALGSVGAAARPALPTLAKLVGDPDPGVRRSALGAAMRIDPDDRTVVAAVLANARRGDFASEWLAVDLLTLAAPRSKETALVLADLLRDPAIANRSTLLVNLSVAVAGVADDPAASDDVAAAVAPVLASARNVPDDRLRAAQLMARLRPAHPAAGVDALAAALSDPNDAVFRTAADALLEGWGSEGRAAARAAAVEYTKALRDPAAKPPARQAAFDRLAVVIRAAADDEPAATAVAAALADTVKSDPNAGNRRAAVRLLAALGPGGPGGRAAVPVLVAALADSDNELRLAAVAALERAGPAAAAAVPALVRMVDNRLASVRRAAAAALVEIDPAGQHAAAAVVAAVRQADPSARRMLVRRVPEAEREKLAKRLEGLAADDPDAAVRGEARAAAREVAAVR